MIGNDRIILDRTLEQKPSVFGPTLSAGKYFEIFAAGEIVMEYDLVHGEIESGTEGDGADGGFDAMCLFANGEVVQDDTDLSSITSE